MQGEKDPEKFSTFLFGIKVMAGEKMFRAPDFYVGGVVVHL